MHIVDLNEENIDEYIDYIAPDAAENIGRFFFRGILCFDEDDLSGGMIWEVRNTMREEKNESNIVWLRIDSDEAGEFLFDNYSDLISRDDVEVSTISLPARGASKEKESLENAGFKVVFMEGDLIKTQLSEIAELDAFKKVKPGDSIRPLKNMTQRGFNAGVRPFMDKGLYGLCQDLPYLPRSYFENDISSYSENEGQVNGLFLFHKNPSGGLAIVVMAAIGNDYGKILPQMIKHSITRAIEIYSPDTEVWIDRHNYASLALSEKLFPRGFGIPVFIGTRQEKY